jgi:hypothetical protein
MATLSIAWLTSVDAVRGRLVSFYYEWKTGCIRSPSGSTRRSTMVACMVCPKVSAAAAFMLLPPASAIRKSFLSPTTPGRHPLQQVDLPRLLT